jgi:hypothetical protein
MAKNAIQGVAVYLGLIALSNGVAATVAAMERPIEDASENPERPVEDVPGEQERAEA